MTLREHLLDGPLGFGSAPLGNMLRDIPVDEAAVIVDAAWAATRYFDTAPFYGAGPLEIRLGESLARHDRNDYVLSTKVGRINLNEEEARTPGRARESRALRVRAHQQSGLRLHGQGNAEVDRGQPLQAWHTPDRLRLGPRRHPGLPRRWLAQFETARTGAFKALTRLRRDGVIKGWGLGVNRSEPIELMLGLTEVDPDGSLLAAATPCWTTSTHYNASPATGATTRRRHRHRRPLVDDIVAALSPIPTWLRRDYRQGNRIEQLADGWKLFKQLVKHEMRFFFANRTTGSGNEADMTAEQLLETVSDVGRNTTTVWPVPCPFKLLRARMAQSLDEASMCSRPSSSTGKVKNRNHLAHHGFADRHDKPRDDRGTVMPLARSRRVTAPIPLLG